MSSTQVLHRYYTGTTKVLYLSSTQVLHRYYTGTTQVLYLRLPSSRSSALFLTSSSHQVGDPLSQAEAEELVREADFNGDGKINYIEFVAMTVRP